MFGQNASIQAFMVILRQHRNKILAAFLVFQKRGLRYANNRPGTGTSHIIGQNLWAKFGVTQSFALKGLKHHGTNVSQFLLSMETPSTWPGDNL